MFDACTILRSSPSEKEKNLGLSRVITAFIFKHLTTWCFSIIWRPFLSQKLLYTLTLKNEEYGSISTGFFRLLEVVKLFLVRIDPRIRFVPISLASATDEYIPNNWLQKPPELCTPMSHDFWSSLSNTLSLQCVEFFMKRGEITLWDCTSTAFQRSNTAVNRKVFIWAAVEKWGTGLSRSSERRVSEHSCRKNRKCLVENSEIDYSDGEHGWYGAFASRAPDATRSACDSN